MEWQEDFFDHRLRSDESLDEKANYVRMNPVRAGSVKTVEEWPYSWGALSGVAVGSVGTPRPT